MSISDIPVFGVLRGTMHMLTSRQKLIANNIANADTPNFTPVDVDQKRFQQALADYSKQGPSAVRMYTTMPGQYIAPGVLDNSEPGMKPLPPVNELKTPGRETTINGNSVVLEDQVANLAQTRMQYDAAVSLYQKSLSLIRLALKAPGK